MMNVLLIQPSKECERLKACLKESSIQVSNYIHYRSIKSALQHLQSQTADIVFFVSEGFKSSDQDDIKSFFSEISHIPCLAFTSSETSTFIDTTVRLHADDVLAFETLQPVLLEKAVQYALKFKQLENRIHKPELKQSISNTIVKESESANNSHGLIHALSVREQNILDALPAHIALVDHEGIIIKVNHAWKTFADNNNLNDPTYAVGKSYFIYDNSLEEEGREEAQLLYTEIKKILSGFKDSVSVEYPCHSPDEKRWFKVIACAMQMDGQHGAIVMHINITERKLMEENLKRSRANLLAIFDNTEDAFTLIDTSYRVIAFNKRSAENIVEHYNKTITVGTSILEYSLENRKENLLANLDRAAKGHTVYYDAQEPFLGSLHWYYYRIAPVYADNHELIGLNICAHDYTVEKRAAQALREREEKFRSLIENHSDMFLICDERGIVTYGSSNIARILNYDINAVIGQSFSYLMHPDEVHKFYDLYNRVANSSKQLFQFKFQLRHANSSWIWAEGTMINLSEMPSVNGIVINFRDVSERVQIDNDLKQTQNFLEQANEVAKLGYWSINLAHPEKFAFSKDLYKHFGFTEAHDRKDIKSVMSLIHTKDAFRLKRCFLKVLKVGGSFNVEFRLLLADKSIRWLQAQAKLIHSDHNNARHIVGVVIDITDHKENEDQLNQSKKNLYALINNTSDAIWSIDSNYRLISANTAFRYKVYEIYGITIQEGEFVFNNPTHDIENWKRYYTTALEGRRFTVEGSLTGKTGDIMHYELNLNPIQNEFGQVVGVGCFYRDITGRKQIENQLRGVNDQYNILLKATNDAVWDWDLLKDTVKWNHGLHSFFGYDWDDSQDLGKWWFDAIHPDDKERIENELKSTFESGAANWASNYRFRCADGSYKYVFDRGYTLYNEHAKPVRMIGAMQDIHELTEYRKQLEKKVFERTMELHQSLQKEKELTEMKSRFVSIASHEFRTPLSTIQFATQFLQNYKDKITPAEIDRKLHTIEAQVQHMVSLLDDVLTVGKAEAGKIEVNKKQINLREFFNQLCANVEHAHKYSHKILINFALPKEEMVTDEKLFRNIFSNLLNNAIKFSPENKTVYLRCYVEEGMVAFEVTDKGIGIKQEDLQCIFEPFTRGSNAGAIQGTGLGLTIVKRSVDLLNGYIEVTSEQNIGTTFRMKFIA